MLFDRSPFIQHIRHWSLQQQPLPLQAANAPSASSLQQAYTACSVISDTQIGCLTVLDCHMLALQHVPSRKAFRSNKESMLGALR